MKALKQFKSRCRALMADTSITHAGFYGHLSGPAARDGPCGGLLTVEMQRFARTENLHLSCKQQLPAL